MLEAAEWVELGAYTEQDVREGMRLVAVDRSCRVALGDLFARVAPLPADGAGRCEPALEAFATRIGLSPATAAQYRWVAVSFPATLREKIASTGVSVPFEVLRQAATHRPLVGPADRWTVLDHLVDHAHRAGEGRVTRERFRTALGLRTGWELTDGDGEPASPEQVVDHLAREAEARTAVASSPDVARSVLQAAVNDPEGPARFFSFLAEEGGLEALAAAGSALRAVKARTRQLEDAALGADPGPDVLEVILRAVERAMRALEKPLDLDPAQIVAALAPAQFSAVDQLCDAVAQWHQHLLAAQRAVHRKGVSAA